MKRIMQGWDDPESRRIRAEYQEVIKNLEDAFAKENGITVGRFYELKKAMSGLDSAKFFLIEAELDKLQELHKNCPRPDLAHEGPIEVEVE